MEEKNLHMPLTVSEALHFYLELKFLLYIQ